MGGVVEGDAEAMPGRELWRGRARWEAWDSVKISCLLDPLHHRPVPHITPFHRDAHIRPKPRQSREAADVFAHLAPGGELPAGARAGVVNRAPILRVKETARFLIAPGEEPVSVVRRSLGILQTLADGLDPGLPSRVGFGDYDQVGPATLPAAVAGVLHLHGRVPWIGPAEHTRQGRVSGRQHTRARRRPAKALTLAPGGEDKRKSVAGGLNQRRYVKLGKRAIGQAGLNGCRGNRRHRRRCSRHRRRCSRHPHHRRRRRRVRCGDGLR